MSLADVVHEERSPCALLYDSENFSSFTKELDRLQQKSVDALLQQRIHKEKITSERYLNMRFHGSDTSMMIQDTNGMDGFLASFERAHQEQFGFLPVGRDVIVDDLRVRSIGSSGVEVDSPWKEELATVSKVTLSAASETKALYFRETGWTQSPVYELGHLKPGYFIAGPALIMDSQQTLVIAPKSSATILSNNVIIDVEVLKKETISITHVDPIQLSIFGHRFMGVAEQMGRALQKTSVSTNIKERLDFSCTVFAADGGLVANAPHVPAMVSSIRNVTVFLAHLLISISPRL
jgi:5-oxoprolinase (ATP-hydrolysing)